MTVKHSCAATGCPVKVAPELLMCKAHWYSVPRALRMRILRSYVPGQEREGWSATSAEYQAAVREVIDYVAIKEGRKTDPMEGTKIE